MTKEEIIDELYRLLSDNSQGIPLRDGAQKERYKEAVKEAVKTLEQEPCEDAVSRKEVYEQINCWIGSGEYKYINATDYLTKRIADLSSVTPKLLESEDAISRQITSDYVESHILEINTGYGDLNAHTNRILRMIVEYIEKMPSVTPTREHGEWTDEVIEKQGNKLIECITTEACKIAKGNIDKARKIIAGKISEEEEKQLIFGADMRKEQK